MAGVLNNASLQQALDNFQSTFEFDTTNLTKDRVRSLIKTLEDDRKYTRKSDEEDVKIINFLSYLYYLLKEKENSLQLLDESLQKKPDNIITNSNKARILLENGEVSEVEEIISKLQELEKRNDYEKRKYYAEAELAYAYARSGPCYNERAVEMFRRIVEAYPKEYTWQLGLGLTLLKRNHPFPHPADSKNEKTTIDAAVRLLAATKSDDPILRAHAYVKLGKAVYSIRTKQYRDLPPEIENLRDNKCFGKGLEICPEEPLLLQICGQYARYRKEFDTSERLIRKSLRIKPTPHGYHHLALTLKRRVDMRGGHNHGFREIIYSREKSGFQQGCNYRVARSPQSPDVQSGGHNQQGQQANWRQKSDSLSEGNWRFNQDKYRHAPRTVYGAGGWRKEIGMNTPKRRCDVGKERTGSGGVLRPTGNIPKERRSSDYVTELSQTNLRKLYRSPLKVQVDSGNKLLVEAIELLEKAEKLQEHSTNMHYDKGILYRMLGQTKRAVEVFKQIVSKKKYLLTPTWLTQVYNQLGVCLLELSESKETPSEIKQKHRKDGQIYLSCALQIQFEIVANDPQFKERFNSHSTIKELMNDKRKPQELIVLCMRMRDHMDNIDNFNDLFMTEECKLVPDESIAMLQGYMKAGQLEDCVTLLCSLECTTIFARLPESLVFEVYINGAFHAYSTDNVQLAYKRFRRAFHVYGMLDKATNKTEADEDTEEILILHSCSQNWKCRFPRNLGTILGDCTGLRYTINTDNVLGNAITTEAMVTLMKKIPCIIIMTHDSEEKYDQLYVNHALQMSSVKNGPQVMVVSNDECNVPNIARTRGVPFIPMPPLLDDAVRQNDQIPDEHQEWVKQFIEKLKPN